MYPITPGLTALPSSQNHRNLPVLRVLGSREQRLVQQDISITEMRLYLNQMKNEPSGKLKVDANNRDELPMLPQCAPPHHAHLIIKDNRWRPVSGRDQAKSFKRCLHGSIECLC